MDAICLQNIYEMVRDTKNLNIESLLTNLRGLRLLVTLRAPCARNSSQLMYTHLKQFKMKGK